MPIIDVSGQAVSDLRAALLRFDDEARAAGLEAEADIHRVSEFLEHVMERRRVEVQRRYAELEQAKGALAVCMRSGAVDREGRYYPPDCSRQEAAARRSAAMLAAAEGQLRDAERRIALVRNAAAEYGAARRRFSRALDDTLSRFVAALAGTLRHIEAYVQERLSMTHGGPDGGGGGSGAMTSASQSIAAALVAAPRFPKYEVSRRSFSDIPLDHLEEPEFAPGEWEEADLDDMKRSFERLPAIRDAIERGDIDRLVATDTDARRVYSWFYGDGAVRLDGYADGRFTVGGGRHRVQMARMLGLSSIPAVDWR